jgi:hypothetical protein
MAAKHCIPGAWMRSCSSFGRIPCPRFAGQNLRQTIEVSAPRDPKAQLDRSEDSNRLDRTTASGHQSLSIPANRDEARGVVHSCPRPTKVSWGDGEMWYCGVKETRDTENEHRGADHWAAVATSLRPATTGLKFPIEQLLVSPLHLRENWCSVWKPRR